MDENLEMEGKLVGIEQTGEGTKKDGTEWTKYKYKINTKEGERTCSGFLNVGDLAGKYVIVTYKEADNPKYPNSPYKNVVNIVQGIPRTDATPSSQTNIGSSESDVKEADKTYNIAPIATEKVGEGTNWDEVNLAKSNQIAHSRAVHIAFEYIIHRQTLEKDNKSLDKDGKVQEFDFEKNFKTLIKKIYTWDRESMKELGLD